MATFEYINKSGAATQFSSADSNTALAALKGFTDADPTSGVRQITDTGPVAPPNTPTATPAPGAVAPPGMAGVTTPSVPNGPITGSQLEQASSLPDPAALLASKGTTSPLSAKVSSVATATLDSSR